MKNLNRRVFLAAVSAVVLTGCVTASAPAGPGAFGIMTYNIRHGEGVDRRVDLERIAQVIHRSRPRYVALQEIDVKRRRTGHVDQAAELGRLTGMVPTFAGAYFPTDDGAYGVMMLSEPKPVSVRRIPLPGREPRVLLLCEFPDVVIGTTHLSVATEEERVESVKIIREAVKGCPKPVFLTGDWNSRPDSETLRGMKGFTRILSPVAAEGGTFHGFPEKPSSAKGAVIDYIAVDLAHADGWKVDSSAVLAERTASDHAPVVVRVSAR